MKIILRKNNRMRPTDNVLFNIRTFKLPEEKILIIGYLTPSGYWGKSTQIARVVLDNVPKDARIEIRLQVKVENSQVYIDKKPDQFLEVSPLNCTLEEYLNSLGAKAFTTPVDRDTYPWFAG